MTIGLGDFAGKWDVRRTITDRHGNSTAHFEGQATFSPDGATLIYEESGILMLGEQRMEAEQRYVWRQDGPRILVTFTDGRPFHLFEPGEITPAARHDCAPDIYNVAYDFGQWPGWSAEWTVTGPRKDYTSRTEYTRLP